MPDFRRVYIQRGAFSLIELLVVCAIIALLLVILLPALAGARDAARAAACGSNVHQGTLAMQMYVGDHRQYLPPVNRKTTDNLALVNTPAWHALLLQNDYLPLNEPLTSAAGTGYSGGLYCPDLLVQGQRAATFQTSADGAVGYATHFGLSYQLYLNGAGDLRDPLAVDTIPAPHGRVFLMGPGRPTVAPGYVYPGVNGGNLFYIFTPHAGGKAATFAYLDGHVAAVRKEDSRLTGSANVEAWNGGF